MDPQSSFAAEAAAALRDAARSLGHDGDLPPLEAPPGTDMGDLGMPCFPLARNLKQAPNVIAERLAEAMQVGGWIARVAAVGPYVNLWVDGARLATMACDDVDALLRPASKPGRILLEHTSANPNGPLHVGRARNPILGDTLARLLRGAGHDVETHYYMDNLGRQVAILAWGLHEIPASDLPPLPEGRNKADHDLVRYYQAANERRENDPAVADAIKELVARLESADDETMAYVRPAYERCFAGMRESLERLGVHHDAIDDESDHVADGSVHEVIELLKESPRAAQEEDGANYLDLAAELEGNKSTKFFFTRRDGTSVYATRDVAYHHWKAKQVGDGLLLNVLGEDHRLQSLQVGIALEELGHRRPDVVFYAFVGLPDGKMSTRANRVVFLDDLLDEAVARARKAVASRRDELDEAELDVIAEAVGVAAIRFNIAKVQPEKPIQFRWEDALDFDGDSAPYLMYAHARAKSLLRKAGDMSAAPAAPGPGEEKLAKVIARYIPVIEDAAARRAPHRFCSYATELAGAFNEYYRDHPVIAAEDAAQQALRHRMVTAAATALAAAHAALGLTALETM